MQKTSSVLPSQLLNLVMSFPVFARPGTVWSRSEKLMAAFFPLYNEFGGYELSGVRETRSRLIAVISTHGHLFPLLMCRTFLTISILSGNLAPLKLILRQPNALNLAYPPHNHQTYNLVMSCPVSVRPGTAVLGGSTTHGHFF